MWEKNYETVLKMPEHTIASRLFCLVSHKIGFFSVYCLLNTFTISQFALSQTGKILCIFFLKVSFFVSYTIALSAVLVHYC